MLTRPTSAARVIKDYDKVYRKLIRSVDLLDVSSSFVMDTLKYTTAPPINNESLTMKADSKTV